MKSSIEIYKHNTKAFISWVHRAALGKPLRDDGNSFRIRELDNFVETSISKATTGLLPSQHLNDLPRALYACRKAIKVYIHTCTLYSFIIYMLLVIVSL